MINKPKVYLETSFISYMVGKDTTNVKIASEQAWTRKWWAEVAPVCDVFASNFSETRHFRRMQRSMHSTSLQPQSAGLIIFSLGTASTLPIP